MSIKCVECPKGPCFDSEIGTRCGFQKSGKPVIGEMNIPYFKANAWAKNIIEAVAPDCEEIHVAGSIRRGCPIVHDIDLVILPRNKDAIKARCRQNAEVLTNGDTNYLIRLSNGVEIDIFFAHSGTQDFFNPDPSNLGSLLLCRTGSKEFNQAIAHRALSRGCNWNPYRGIIADNCVVASRTEHEIFAYLDMPYIPPENRTSFFSLGAACKQ